MNLYASQDLNKRTWVNSLLEADKKKGVKSYPFHEFPSLQWGQTALEGIDINEKIIKEYVFKQNK